MANTQPMPLRLTGAVIDGQGSWCRGGAHGDSIPLKGVVPLFDGFKGVANEHPGLPRGRRILRWRPPRS